MTNINQNNLSQFPWGWSTMNFMDAYTPTARSSSLLRGVVLTAILLAFVSTSAFASPISLMNATATLSQVPPSPGGNFLASQAIDGTPFDGDGWAIADQTGATNPQIAVFQTVTDQGLVGGVMLTFNLIQVFGAQHTIGDFRLSVTTANRTTYADGLQNGGNVGSPAIWTVLTPLTAVATDGAILTINGDGSILASGPSPATSTYTVTAETFLTGITGIRLEVLANASLPTNGPGREPANGNFVLSQLTLDGGPRVPEPSSISLVFGGGALGLMLFRKRFVR
jgi:hypothetical protein